MMTPGLRQAFRCFARNERWGTCATCPGDEHDRKPELCMFTNRRDHQLTLDALVHQYQWLQEHPEYGGQQLELIEKEEPK
jgi:hypothetical protein